MRTDLIQELRALADRLGPDIENAGPPRRAAEALQRLIEALGSAKVALINRNNAGTDEWELLARAAVQDIAEALGAETIEG